MDLRVRGFAVQKHFIHIRYHRVDRFFTAQTRRLHCGIPALRLARFQQFPCKPPLCQRFPAGQSHASARLPEIVRITPQHLDYFIHCRHFAFQRQRPGRTYVHAFAASDAFLPIHPVRMFRADRALPARPHTFSAPDAFLPVIHHIRLNPLRFRIAAPQAGERAAL